jgi:hypothetical protein
MSNGLTMMPPPAARAANAANVVEGLRRLPRDAHIDAHIRTMAAADLALLSRSLAQQPALVIDLCLNSRGVVVSHLFEAAGGDACRGVFATLWQHIEWLVSAHSGCIAVTNVYAAAAPWQRWHLEAYVARNTLLLSVSAGGNYLVQKVIETGAPDAVRAIGHALSEALQLLTTSPDDAVSRCGTYVVDTFFRRAADVDAMLLFLHVIEDAPLLQRMAHHKFANYTLRHALRRAVPMLPPPELRRARDCVEVAAKDSIHRGSFLAVLAVLDSPPHAGRDVRRPSARRRPTLQ